MGIVRRGYGGYGHALCEDNALCLEALIVIMAGTIVSSHEARAGDGCAARAAMGGASVGSHGG